MKVEMFGAYLLKNKKISEDQLRAALSSQRFTQRRLGRILRDLNILSSSELNEYLTDYLKPVPSKEQLQRILSSAPASVPPEYRAWCQVNRLVIISMNENTIQFGTEAFNDILLESANRKWRKRCYLTILGQDIFDLVWEKQQASSSEDLSSNVSADRISEAHSHTPYGHLFKDLLGDAHCKNASDIHIEPNEGGVQIRLRIHGRLQSWRVSLPKEHRQAFLLEVKRLSNLDIARSGIPQDSRFSEEDYNSDYRVNLFPTLFGEKIVLRILRRDQNFNLKSIEVDAGTMNAFQRAISLRSGLVVLSGPTGSGKTTTLFRLLNAIDQKAHNISTLEDPVEYVFPGFNQSSIRSGKLSFSDGLRALMRQDPDIILVGEIRDSETAELCLKAASTGHLVFSSIHANSAIEVPNRLISMGAAPYLVKANLRYSFAQRLEPKLCPACSQSIPESWERDVVSSVRQLFPLRSPATLRTANPNGCPKCALTGVIGRIPLIERMEPIHIEHYFSDRPNQPVVASSLKQIYTSNALDGLIDAKTLKSFL